MPELQFFRCRYDVAGAILISREGDFDGQNRIEFSVCGLNQRFLNAIAHLPLVFGLGLLSSISVLTSQAFGARRPDDAGETLRHGLLIATGMGVLAALAFPGQRGAVGIWIGLAGGLGAAALGLAWRFHIQTGKAADHRRTLPPVGAAFPEHGSLP